MFFLRVVNPELMWFRWMRLASNVEVVVIYLVMMWAV
jgi:hypothetical protein